MRVARLSFVLTLCCALAPVAPLEARGVVDSAAVRRAVHQSALATPLRRVLQRVAPKTLQRISRERHQSLEAQLADPQRGGIFPSQPHLEVVLAPIDTFDPEEVAKIPGAQRYEQRQVGPPIARLRDPNKSVLIVTHGEVSPAFKAYCLSLLPEEIREDAEKRLHFFKVPERRRLDPWVSVERLLVGKYRRRLEAKIRQIKEQVREHYGLGEDFEPATSLRTPNTVDSHRQLAVLLGVPLLGAPIEVQDAGSKVGARWLIEDIYLAGSKQLAKNERELVETIDALIARYPKARALMLKLNESFSGEGNARFETEGLAAMPPAGRRAEIRRRIRQELDFTAAGETWRGYRRKMKRMGVAVELYYQRKADLSAQGYIHADGTIEILSTHVQHVVKGVYEGAESLSGEHLQHRERLHEMLVQTGEALVAKAKAAGGLATGPFGIDVIYGRVEGDEDAPYELLVNEINLRSMSTSAPPEWIKQLTGGHYDPPKGHLVDAAGNAKFYRFTDLFGEVPKHDLRGLDQETLLDLIRQMPRGGAHGPSGRPVAWDKESGTGLITHMPNLLPTKLAFAFVGDSAEEAEEGFQNFCEELLRWLGGGWAEAAD